MLAEREGDLVRGNDVVVFMLRVQYSRPRAARDLSPGLGYLPAERG